MMNTKTAIGAISAILLSSVLCGSGAAYARVPGTRPPRHRSTAVAHTCAVLSASLLEKVVGGTFDDQPSQSKAPPPYGGAWGWDCQYFSKPPFATGHQTRIDLVIYDEASAAVAKETFDKTAMIFEDRSKPKPSGIGDAAYWDALDDEEPSINVLKGSAHFRLGMQPANDAQLTKLAIAVASQL